VGPEYTGTFCGEQPLATSFATAATLTLRRVQSLGGAAGFAALSCGGGGSTGGGGGGGGGVMDALRRRGVAAIAPHLNVTERSQQRRPLERAKATERFYSLLDPEQASPSLTFTCDPAFV
jgi:hypothetical protein